MTSLVDVNIYSLCDLFAISFFVCLLCVFCTLFLFAERLFRIKLCQLPRTSEASISICVYS